MRAAAFIPATNGEAALAEVLAGLPPGHLTEVVVVVGASRGASAAVARKHGAAVVIEPRPGRGRACLAGAKILLAVLLPAGKAPPEGKPAGTVPGAG